MKRGSYKLSTYHNIKDRRLRERAQNLEASRRFRKKRKAQSELLLKEEAMYAEKNRALRLKVANKENKIKTLKQLMEKMGIQGQVCMPKLRVI